MLARQTPWSYTARAKVSDAPDGRYLYAAPVAVVDPGERESVTQRAGEYQVTFTVAVVRRKTAPRRKSYWRRVDGSSIVRRATSSSRQAPCSRIRSVDG